MDKNTALFLNLIFSLQENAMMALGKIKDPNGIITHNLDVASATIDMLDMLKAKCSGNLNNDEDQILHKIISDLKLNFVDEKNRSRDKEQIEASESQEPPNN